MKKLSKRITYLVLLTSLLISKGIASQVEKVEEMINEKATKCISQNVIDQVQRIKDWSTNLKEKNQKIFLILGSANVEMSEATPEKNWVFWNLSSNQGLKSLPNLNPYIDADFNDKDIIRYVHQELKHTFAEIVFPEQAIDYIFWKLSDFKMFRDMLAPQGYLIFSINWQGENSKCFTSIQPANDVLSLDFINIINRFDLSYEEREEYLAKTYNYDISKVLSFNCVVEPFVPTLKDLEVKPSSIDNDIKEEVESLIISYFNIINDSKYQGKTQEFIFREMWNEIEEDVKKQNKPNLRSIMFIHFWNSIPFFKEAEAREEFTERIFLISLKKKISSSYRAAKENYLKREFKKLFSEVYYEDISREDKIKNNLPSLNFQRGSRVIYLVK